MKNSILTRLCAIVGLFTTLLGAASSAHAAVVTGSYTGDGVDNRLINLGFQPDVVLVARNDSNNVMQIRFAGMTVCKDMGNTGAISTGLDRIKSLTATGFTVGTAAHVNSSTVLYHYLAISQVPGEIAIGSYTGDGTDNRNITGLAFQPSMVMTMRDGATSVWRVAAMAGDVSNYWDTVAGTANLIQALNVDGFQVGTDGAVNSSGLTHYYIACKEVAGKFKTGSYVGTGADQTISGVGFTPAALFMRRLPGTTSGGGRFGAVPLSTDLMISVNSTAGGPLTAAITSITTDGFTLGTSGSRANGLGITYPYFAMAAVAPTASPPTVTNVSPASGPSCGGQKITITGTNFTGVTGVTVGGTAATSVTLVNPTTITCGTPAHAAAAGQSVVVTTPAGFNTANSFYTYYAATVADFETGTTGLPTGTTFVNSDGTWSLTGFLVDGSSAGLGSSPVAAPTPPSNKYLDSGLGQARSASAGGTTVGAINAPTGKTFKAVALDIWPSKDSGSSIIPYTTIPNGVDGETGHNFLVKGFLNNVEVASATVADTLRFPPQSGPIGGGHWHNLDLSTTAFATTSIDKLEFFLLTQSGNATDGPNIGSPLSTPNYIALDNLVYKDLTTAATPTITNVTSPNPDGTHSAVFAQFVDIEVSFDASVTVTGTPTLALNSGGTATYSSGSPGTTLSFLYTVGAGQNTADLDYTSTAALALNGGTINATTGGAAANLTLPAPGAPGSLGANKNFIIDTTAPTVGISAPSVSTIAAGAGSVTYTVTYTDVNFLDSSLNNGNITLNSTGTAGGTVGVSGSGNTRTVTISSITGMGTLGISIIGGTAMDNVFNQAGPAGPSATFAVTAPAPTVTMMTMDVSADALSVLVQGTNFVEPSSGNTVTFSPAGSGIVFGGGPNSLLVSPSGLRAGPLYAVVSNSNGNSGPPVQVATVRPVISGSLADLATTATTLTINGFGFDPTPANNTVNFSPSGTGIVTASTSTSLTVTGLTGLTVGTLSATVVSNGAMTTFGQPVANVIAPVPTVVSVNPLGGPAVGGTIVTITGTNFTGANTVTFGGNTASFMVDSPTQITATTPPHMSGPVSVLVTTPDGTNAPNTLFTYDSPSVLSVNPPTGSIAGNTNVTITGANFTGASTVTFGGTPATSVVVVNDSSITCTTPAHAAGAVSVVVVAGGQMNGPNTLFTYFTPAPEIAVSGNSQNITDGDATPTMMDDTDFGSAPVQGVSVTHTFTIANSGTANLTIGAGAITVTGSNAVDFTVGGITLPATVNPSGSTTFTVTFDPGGLGLRSATVNITNNDSDEGAFDFAIQGVGTGPRTFDLAGNAVSNTPFDGGQTYIYSAGPPPPAPVSSPAGDVVTGGGAPNASGADSGADFDVLKRGGYLAENGNLVFPGQLLINGTTVTLSPNTFMGLWKENGTGLKLLARSGDPAPETGPTAPTSAKFDVLPQTPAINDSGEVTFLASLATNPSSTPPTTTDNDTGLWSELGGTGLGILIREGDVIPGLSPLQVGAFASGAFATAHTSATTGEAAFAITIKDGANLTDTAILRTSVTSAAVTAVGLVARENAAAPGTAETFNNLAGTYSDPMRMDATGNLAFVAVTKPSGKEGLWYQPVAGATAKVFTAGDTAPGTSNATFKNIKSPAMGSGGVITFRGLLNLDGDNAAGLKNDGIWRGTGSTAAGYTCILRRGDSTVPGLPVGSKVGNLWHSWLTNANHGAWKGWLDVDGNGTSAAPTDVYALYSDLSGTMNFVLKVGDAAPGIAGATFSGFDLPVVGGVEQMAFIGNVTGGGTTSANNSGVWRSAPNGGALTLVIRTGDTMTTSQGVRTIQKVDFPGSGSTDRRWEQPIMDATGRLIVFVTFTSASGGGTSQILVP